MSMQIQYYVLVGWNKVQEPQREDGKAKLKISGCIHHIKMLWESMEKQLNSSGTAIRAGTMIGPVIEVHVVKILEEYGLEVAIPSICKLGDTTYVVICREKLSAL